MNKIKILSLAMVFVMVMSAFGMIMPAAKAQIVNKADTRNIIIGSSSIDNYDPFGDDFFMKPIYPGSQNVAFSIRMDNDGGDAMSDDDPIEWANLSISTTIRNEAGSSVTTPISNWDQQRVDDMATIWEWDWHTFNGFQFDVKAAAVPGVYNLTVTLEYKNDVGTAATYVGYILFEIRQRVEVPDIGGLTPGDFNVPVNFPVGFEDSMPGTIEDVSISVTLPDTDFSWFGVSGATIAKTSDGPFYSWSTWNIQLLLTVSVNKDKGVYTGHYSVTYTSGGTQYTETGDVEFQVGDLPMLSVAVGTATLTQGVTTATWSLTFTNVGTVDLLNIKAQLDDDSDAFTFMPADHWEDGNTVTYSWLELGDVAVGASVVRTMEVGIDLYIPVGVHKIMFTFWGMYYDPDSATYNDVTVDWTMGAIAHVPRVNGVTFDPETSTVKGPYIDVTVIDTVMDVMITSMVTLNTGGQTLDNALTLSVQNLGNIDYTNVVLQVETNTADSPFINVVDPAATLSEEAPITGTLGAGDTRTVTVRVNLLPDTDLGVYMIPVTISGINLDMGEVISTVIDARVTIRGIGPQIEITSVTPEKIKAGEVFTLTLVLTNVGDDTARNIVLNSWVGDEITTIDGNYATPMADALPMYIGDIAAGGTLTVEIPMRANSDISGGHVYSIVFDIDYVDSFGYGPSTDWIAATVKSTGNGGSILATFYWTMVVLAIVIAIFLMIVAFVFVRKNRKPKVASAPEYTPPPPPGGMVEP